METILGETEKMTHVSLVIVGGGVQGCFFAGALNKFGFKDFLIIDPSSQLMNRWFTTTSNSQVEFLRSSSSHSIASNFHSFRNYAKRINRTRVIHERDYPELSVSERLKFDFLMPYHRPSRDLFNLYSKEFIKYHTLDTNHVIGTVKNIEPNNPGGFLLTLGKSSGSFQISAQNVLLATGDPGEANVPEWLKTSDSEVKQKFFVILDNRYIHPEVVQENGKIIVIGGGISGVQTAIWASETRSASTWLIAPHNLLESQFDFDPGFIGPKYFQKIGTDSAQRYPGTIPRELKWKIEKLEKKGKITIIRDTVEKADADSVLLKKNGKIQFDTGFIATGLAEKPIQLGDWIASLPQKNGKPRLTHDLQWARGLYCTGPLAMNELGPPAPNFIGAHLAARRILPSLGINFHWRFNTRDQF